MHARWTRFVAASTLTVAVAGTGLFAGSGSANASTPIVIGSCATSIQGAPGTPVELSPAAVVQPLVTIVNAVPLLGPGLAAPFQSAFEALPPIPLGALPDGTGYITGGQVANAVVAAIKQIPLLGPILGTVITSAQSVLTSGCGVTVQGVNAAVAPVQDGAGALANAGTQLGQSLGLGSKTSTPGNGQGPGGAQSPPGNGAPQGSDPGSGQGLGSNVPVTGAPGIGDLSLLDNPAFGAAQLLDDGLAESPLARYSGIPFASAGMFAPSPGVRYGGDVPGYSPGYGVLNNSGTPQPDGIQTAGEAEALGPGSTPGDNGIGLPMLLAVLALSGATAGLVRTWVLRRVRPL
ncbi:MAG TPA: hypothetical protein VHX38_32570 [Pseudonocardiaceae bacterium]|jgi:hypothetical protein|nr:hypothetical protein [Pseudonocardiaceae bacterium]